MLDENRKVSVVMDMQNPTGIIFMDALCTQGGTYLNGGKVLPFSVKAFIADGRNRYACSNAACDSQKDWVLQPNTHYVNYFYPYESIFHTNEKSIVTNSIESAPEGYSKFVLEFSWGIGRTVYTGIELDWTTSKELVNTCVGWTGLDSANSMNISILQSTSFDPDKKYGWSLTFDTLPDICFSPIQIDTVNQKTVYSTTWKRNSIGLLCIEQ